MTWEEANFKKFENLVKWASRRYVKVFPNNYKDYSNLVGEGFEVLAICLNRWKEIENERLERSILRPKTDLIPKNIKTCNGVTRIIPKRFFNDKEFEKFFKTSLFNKYKGIARQVFSKKYSVHFVDEKEIEFSSNRTPFGFEEAFYQENIEHVRSCIENDVEKLIFTLLIDPPSELRNMALDQNRRKMKISFLKQCKGVNKVKLSTKLILEYLNNNHVVISEEAYRNSIRNIKRIVKEVIL